jgi:hypothetical protein
MNTYKPTRPLLRVAFVAVALLATIASAAFIEGLVRSYNLEAGQMASTAPAVVAAARR